ncbi:MAG: FixH family protein, partial [Pseudomonadota bacterium]
MNTYKPKTPWYREPWVWLMIALPMTAVIGGMITIYLAVTTSDGLVVDDYYKRGKAINRDLARDAAAAGYQLRASFDLDLRNNHMQLQLEGTTAVLPKRLTFSLLHPTQPGHDQVIVLQHAGDGFYSGRIDEVARGNWYLQLEADDWRLSGSMQIPQTETTVLLPLDAEDE